MRKPADTLRAVVITVVLVVQAVYAAPRPSRITKAELRRAETAEEVANWASLLGMQPDTLGKHLVAWSGGAADMSVAIRRPLRPLLRFFGVGQAWAMFATPDTWPHRLEIDLKTPEGWVPLYRRWGPEQWRSATLRNRRVRGIYDGATERNSIVYWNFTRWVAREALLEHPEASAVRVRMIQLHTTVAGDAHEKARKIRTHKRTAVLPDDGLVP